MPKSARFNTRILPIAAIYGGNASGKTNFFKALNFARTLIVKGTQPDSPIPVETFRLDNTSDTRPTRFTFELLIEETLYEFSFAFPASRLQSVKIRSPISGNRALQSNNPADELSSKAEQLIRHQ